MPSVRYHLILEPSLAATLARNAAKTVTENALAPALHARAADDLVAIVVEAQPSLEALVVIARPENQPGRAPAAPAGLVALRIEPAPGAQSLSDALRRMRDDERQ